ncbi:MAG: matrixin family metalloprotease, partial [Acidobacteriota bacterium]|nr:matrixin family metalloprotease [Acidobacteriota bacterium]
SAALSYYLLAGSTDLGPSLQSGEIARALAEWARFADVRWRPEVRAHEPRSLTIMWGPRDHGDPFPFAPEVLAHAFYPAPSSPEPLAGDIHFNEAYEWGVGDPARYDIFSVALHETGHSLGLAHSSNPTAVMYAHYQGIVQGLADEDGRAIQTLYAQPGGPAVSQSWADGSVGGPIGGNTVERDGTYTLSATGRDVWGSADELRFTSRTLSGDGDIVARLDSLAAAHRWTKAGIMIRGSSAAGAPHAFVLVSGGQGIAFQRRTTAGGLTTSTSDGAGTAPRWLWLSRRGNRVSAYAAVDRGAWRLVGTDTISMGVQALAGLALSSHDPATTATAVFSNVSVASAPAWSSADIGAVGSPGWWRTTTTGVRVAGAGADAWGTADAFHFVWVPLAGDGEIVARLASVQNVHAWTKAGVMIRESLEAGSPHAFMIVSGAKGYAFQRRVVRDGVTASTAAGTGIAPQWVMLRRRGNVLSALRSADGISWILAGSQTIAMQQRVLAGLAVSSHVPGVTSQAVFDNVRLR